MKNTQGECKRGQFKHNYGRVICPASRRVYLPRGYQAHGYVYGRYTRFRYTQTADTGSSVAELRTVITDRNYGPYGRKTALTDAIRITDRNYGITDRNYGNRNYGLSVIRTQERAAKAVRAKI